MYHRVQLSAIFASTISGGIGLNGTLPWPRLKEDMRMFHDITTRIPTDDVRVVSSPNCSEQNLIHEPQRMNAVVCGRKTWDSLPTHKRPLPKRLNLIVSRTMFQKATQPNEGDVPLLYVTSEQHRVLPPELWITTPVVFERFKDVLCFLKTQQYLDIHRCFAIGGAAIFEECVSSSYCQSVYWTWISAEFEHDVRLTVETVGVIEDKFTSKITSKPIHQDAILYYFHEYERRNETEMSYLKLVSQVMKRGCTRIDRTNVGTKALFGGHMYFHLGLGFPLLTTKRVFFRGVVEELLWMIRGCTDSNKLSQVGVKIWDKNGSKEFLESRGLGHRREGDLGPVYGFQWRHFGAKYTDCDADYTGQGVDQLQAVIDAIKTNPTDRRIIMSAWNPSDINEMALPPCHMMCQFFVDTEKKTLSCKMEQRSCDLGLGVPFNIASYALLTHMIAMVCNLRPGTLIISMGDVHVYMNHFEGLELQLTRPARAFPTLRIKRQVDSIDAFVAKDFDLEGYDPHPAIPLSMAV